MAVNVARSEEASQRVLVFAPIGRDGKSVSELLIRSGIATDVCKDYDDLLRGLEAGADAAIVAEEGLFGQPLDLLDEWLANQPPWSDLPFVMLTSHHEEPNVAKWRHQQIQRLGNVSLIERPVQAITLLSVMRTALRARRRQLEIRAHILAREGAAAELESLVLKRTAELQAANVALRDEMSERARVEQSLRHAQKLEAVGQLTGGIAHDFNNLLMVITAGLEMLERRSDPARRETLMRGMRQAAQRGAGLTRQLLAFSRSRELRPESVDLARLISDTRALLDRSLRGDIEVNVDLAPGLWPVIADPGELELVILNLAVNARDAMPNGGVITLQGENVDDADGRGEFVRLAVRDTGVGMADAIKARVFEPFFTTKDVGKGSGLGLAQVYGFAKQSGGSVTIDSTVGQGTTITLLLPRSHAPAQAHGPMTLAAEASPPRSNLCVLLVEDDGEVAALVGEMLHSIGYEVLHTASAAAALGALANGRRVDLVFSDIMMPGGTNGVELAREVRKRRADLPILLTSGFSEAIRKDADALGIPVLSKPYGLEDLRAAVEAQLAGYAVATPS
ncbi:ATP-binding protein [Pseudoxanthomonas indica]|uniref:histidine kinase n=1 Tax=Pseudoxanthomonas indica TaxID=428993 RepID=A0A1T5LX83_9GAMM|nr:ATP-binding protein [Pseudoxanthomonas indica]GGD41376.1 hybrid sensor histidine kinase/response regulator [Pseudoxanthomonas indica]SKC80444.1 His Kinase A (phospho-acceptor) domain-containing protein [Pseudoxanthomonas indica]